MAETQKNLRPGWKPGQSGNPAGKRKGTRNRATLLAIAVMEKDVKAISKVITAAALGGNLHAARMVLDRLVPPARERPVSIELPDTSTAEGIAQAQLVILEAVGKGNLAPSEAATLSGIVDARRKALETQEFEVRLAALEEHSERSGEKKHL